MDILGVGPIELLIVMVIALIAVGPERLPQVARDIGKTWRQIQGMSRMVANQWQEELTAATQMEADKKNLREALTEPLKEAKADVERALTAPVVTPIQTISNAQPAVANPPTGLPTVVEAVPSDGSATVAPAVAAPQSAVESAPDPAGVVPADPADSRLDYHDAPPEVPAPTASSGDDEPVKQDTTPEPVVSATISPDENPEHGN